MSQIPRNNQPIITNQRLPRRPYSALPILREWQLRGTSMASIKRPLCFAVADYEDAGVWHGGWVVLRKYIVWEIRK